MKGMPLPAPDLSRALYVACTLCAMAALLLAGRSLWHVVAEPEPAAEVVLSAASGTGPEEGAQPARTGAWPAIFGAPDPELPVATPPARMPATYELKGLVTSGGTRWAILSANGADELVREGDVLAEGVEVESIRPEGVWLRFEDLRELVAFSDAAPIRTASVALRPGDGTGTSPRRQDVRTQSLTPTQLRDLILKSEADRAARGLVAPKNDEAQ